MNSTTTGAVLCALAVIAGAFGAHLLEDRLTAGDLTLWETAARYLMYGGLGLMLVGRSIRSRIRSSAGWALGAGASIFAGTLFAMALGAPRWLGAITPIGGALLILGFLLTGWSASRRDG